MKETNDKFITVSLICVFVLVMMISFGATVNETFSASEIACYTCGNSSSSGKYLWGDYSTDNTCGKMDGFSTKESCLINNCLNTEKLDSEGNCVNNDGLVTVMFKSGSLTVYRSTCTLVNGSCRIALRQYQNNVGWSEDPTCSKIVDNSDEYITFSKAKTYTYYSCTEKKDGSSSKSSNKSSSKESSLPEKSSAVIVEDGTNSNPETGSTWIVFVFLGGFVVMLYMGYMYGNGIESKK